MRRALLLDLDGSIIERDFSRISPTSWLDRILRLGRPVAICTNQGGVAWNLAGGRPGKSYPDWPGIVGRITAGMRWAGVHLAFVALHHPNAPIPSGKLLWERGQQIGLPPLLVSTIGLEVRAIVPIPEGIIIASWSPSWRKPAPGMLQDAKKLLGSHYRWAYVGDEDDDEIAARSAGMEFIRVGIGCLL